MEYEKVLSIPKIPDHLKKIPYEAEGPISAKVKQYQTQLSQGNKLQFDKLIELQEGDSQKLGQPQISFLRQAMACTFYPELLKKNIYSQDVIKRAESYLKYFLTIGVYPDAQGFDDCRDSICKFLMKRDGYPSDPKIIFTTAGAIHGINEMVEFLIKDKHKDGIMIPIPSHPIFQASIYSEGGKVVEYELDEVNNWEIQIKDLKNSLDKAAQAGTRVKGILIINPNNPTGQILAEQKIKEIIQFCYDNSLAIIADEIYQDNIYNPNQKFISFKKVIMDMGKTYSDALQLISLNSISAGYYGECGLRGGFMELLNIEEGVLNNLYKLDGMYSTPNNSGQLALELMTNPPSKENNCSQETIDTFNKEISQIAESQKKRANIVTEYLKQCKNIIVADINASLYAFPKIELSSKAVKAAEEKGIAPDAFYCFECLDETGIALRPGSEFGQKAGTHHFRMSILQYDVAQMEEIMKKFKAFNEKFHAKFA